jgi:hypothetical protein
MFLKAKEGEEGPESQVPSRSWEKRWDQRERWENIRVNLGLSAIGEGVLSWCPAEIGSG